MEDYRTLQFNRQIFGKKKKSLITEMGNLLFVFFVLIFCVFMLFSWVYTGISIKGPSMMPLINPDYRDNPSKEDIAYYREVDNYDYGDLVIASVADDNKEIIKRVIGLPGDYIEIKKSADGFYYVYRNGFKIEEDYILSRHGMQSSNDLFDKHCEGHITVGANQLFIMGDNRGDSKDSTYYGCFDYDDIAGRVDYLVEAGEVPFISMFLQLFFPIFKPSKIV